MDLPHPMLFACVKQDAFGNGCLARIDVRNNPNVANSVDIKACHGINLSSLLSQPIHAVLPRDFRSDNEQDAETHGKGSAASKRNRNGAETGSESYQAK
jgi:hypothetical protein